MSQGVSECDGKGVLHLKIQILTCQFCCLLSDARSFGCIKSLDTVGGRGGGGGREKLNALNVF